jgi:uncharacterized protein (TIGR03083 family)
MADNAQPWIAALRRSHERLSAAVAGLDEAAIVGPSYASEWTIAQVLSHLGSGAEIFGLLVDAGLGGEAAPEPETFQRIWSVWDARSPRDQVDASVDVNAAFVGRLEALDDADLARFTLPFFGSDLDATGLLAMRLSEHAVHTWDVVVALDATAALAPDATDLLIDAIPTVIARTAKPAEAAPPRVRARTSAPERDLLLETAPAVRLTPYPATDPAAADGGDPTITLPAEALVRLVYGRLDPDHTPPLETRGVDLDALRAVFPGF